MNFHFGENLFLSSGTPLHDGVKVNEVKTLSHLLTSHLTSCNPPLPESMNYDTFFIDYQLSLITNYQNFHPQNV